MSKNRTKRRNKAKPENKVLPSSKQKWRNSLPLLKQISSRTWAIVGIVGTLICLISGIMVFSSRVTVSCLSPVNPDDPFSTPFSVSNDGAFSIYDIKFRCYFKKITFPNGGGLIGALVEENTAPIEVVQAGEKATYKCLLSAPNALNIKANIYIIATYQPQFLPYRIDKSYRFILAQGSDNQWY